MTHPHSVMEWHADCAACSADGDPAKVTAATPATGASPTKMPRGKLPKTLPAETGRPIPADLIPIDEFPDELVDDTPERKPSK